jgi:hypothetical protein
MDRSPTTGKIDAAIRLIQQAIDPITKDKIVKVDGDRATWQSGFITFNGLHAVIKPHLREHEITLYQYPTFGAGGERFATRLTLGDEYVEADYPVLSSKPGPMGYGAGRSFAKRWGLMDLLGIVAEDAGEKRGYDDERAPSRAKQRAPQGIAAALAAIRSATADADFIAAAQAARASFATEPAVEQTITGWIVNACAGLKSLDELTTLRDVQNVVRARGVELSEAMRKAGVRWEGGK